MPEKIQGIFQQVPSVGRIEKDQLEAVSGCFERGKGSGEILSDYLPGACESGNFKVSCDQIR